jgi:flagellar biosynthesis/type III secretory pathway protein FliH
VKSKEQAMCGVDKMIEAAIEGTRRYYDGYKEGYSEGYDEALTAAREVAEKYNLGGQELKPAVKFMQNSIGAQIQKIYEEFIEVSDAYNNGESTERVAEEACDVQQTCETLLAMLGYDDEERRKLRQKVLCKNASRGYYNE